jgi:hypothetical protein
MKTQSKKMIGFWLSIFVFVMGMGLQVQVKTVFGAGEYSFSDTTSNTQVSGFKNSFSGNSRAYIDFDSTGTTQIYVEDLTTGVKEKLTTASSFKDSLKFNGHIIVWTDKRNSAPNTVDRSIYSYNLLTREEKQLNVLPGQLVAPSVDGNYVVWFNRSSNDMYVYDLTLNQVRLLGQGVYPIVAEGKVVAKLSTAGGLSVTDLITGIVREVVRLPYSISIDAFTFNGQYALWLQNNLDHASKYCMINVNDLTAQPTDLTTASVKHREYIDMTIGNNQAAWLEDKSGVAQIMGVQLSTKETYAVTHANVDQDMLSFAGDQLLLKSNDGYLVYRNVIRTEIRSLVGNTSDSQNISSSPAGALSSNVTPLPSSTPEPVGITDELQLQMDANGGQLSAEHGRVTLTVPKGSFMGTSLVQISKKENSQDKISQKLSSKKRLLSAIWEVHSQSAFLKPVLLSVSFDTKQVIPQQLKKLGVFQYDSLSEKWTFVNGVSDADSGLVKAQLKHPGTYAVMLNEVSFADIQGHWAQQGIEIAASREIVNGMTEGAFLPDASLTRAQFTKMLVSAMGLNLVETSATTSFQDVSANYWGKTWIETSVKEGITQGDNGQFHPDTKLSREQMFIMLVRALHVEDQAKALTKKEIDDLLTNSDKGQISEWAKPYAALALKLKLITGNAKGAIAPAQFSTRAEAVVVINRLLTIQKQI